MATTKKQGKKQYKAKAGSRLTQDQAQVVGEAVDHIRQAKGGCKAEDLLEEAEHNPRSPLHGMFEWNDSEAARKYRIDQARYFIRSIEVEIIINRIPVRTRAFEIMTTELQGPTYQPIEIVMANKAAAGEAVQNARKELHQALKKLETLSHLAGFDELFTEVLETLERQIEEASAA